MLSIAICDDDEKQCYYIKEIISDHNVDTPEAYQISIYVTGEDLYTAMQKKEHFDILFLNIGMERINGIEVGKRIRDEFENHVSQIIFISSSSQYLKPAFYSQPVSFLEKPLNPREILKALRISINRLNKQVEAVFHYKAAGEECEIMVREIFCFKSAGREVEMVTRNVTVRFEASLEKIYQDLRFLDFFYSNRSCLVNDSHVASIGHQKIILLNGMEIPVSTKKFEEIRDNNRKYKYEELKKEELKTYCELRECVQDKG